MRLHILGICGTFMSGIALLAKQSGYAVSGSDAQAYPPMSTQLLEQGIEVREGYDAAHIDPAIDQVIVGNVIKRGNPAMEYILANKIPYISGPQWLFENVLNKRWVLAVAGTHGKTTTTSLLTWILSEAGLSPGFLIGGVPENFGRSASLGKAPFFVIEADEYDSAFFDKRSKFLHYHPHTLILNNLEYDHADIFPDMAAIKLQFHYLLRTVPANGKVICHAQDKHLHEVLQQGCWTPVTTFSQGQGDWQAQLHRADGSAFSVWREGRMVGEVTWSLLGKHNVDNALAALAAAEHAGVPPEQAVQSLAAFKSVKRRLEVKGQAKDIVIYDDFAHHPTAIATTLAGLRAKVGKEARIIAVTELGSYTMRTGVHKDSLPDAFHEADLVICKNTQVDWGLAEVLKRFKQPAELYETTELLINNLVPKLRRGDQVVVMSNAAFDGIHQKLLDAIGSGNIH